MKLPFSLGIQLVYRILLPGIIFALSVYPLEMKALDYFDQDVDFLAVFTIIALLSGWLFSVFDMHVYMLLEGRRYWPNPLFKWGVDREKARLNKLTNSYRNNLQDSKRDLLDENQRAVARHNVRELSVDLRWFPVSENGEPEVVLPTRFGNILAAYERYPETIYGMDAVFYWPRLWLEIDEKNRAEIDGQQAVVDGATYSSVALMIGGVPLLLGGFLVHWGNFIWAIVYVGSAFGLYRSSLYAHAQFGELFKAVFDTHHDKWKLDGVVERIKEDIKRTDGIDLVSKRGQARNVWRWLHNRRLMKDGVVYKVEELAAETHSKAAHATHDG